MYKEVLKRGNAYDLGDLEKENISGAKKCAVLLMTLGSDLSAEIIKNLSDKQIQKIGVEIANLNNVTANERREILKEFIELKSRNEFSIQGGIDYAENLLYGAFDDSKANELIDGIKYEAYTKVFTSARKASTSQILSCIQGESSQTIAIVMSHIQPEKAAEIMCNLGDELQREVALKLGSISKVSPIIVKAVDSEIEKKLSSINEEKVDSSTGFDSLLDILIKVDGKTEKNIMNFLEVKNNILAERVKSNLFAFEDIVSLDNTSIQRILKEVNLKDVALALKDVNSEISDAILRNQSTRAAEALKEEISLLGAVKASQVEEAKRNIVKIVRRLEKEGFISIDEETEEKFVV